VELLELEVQVDALKVIGIVVVPVGVDGMEEAEEPQVDQAVVEVLDMYILHQPLLTIHQVAY